MRVDVGEASPDLSDLLARVEAGEEVEIARDGVPIARLVKVQSATRAGARLLAARGSLSGRIRIRRRLRVHRRRARRPARRARV